MAASTVYDFNRGWLFGGEYVANSEQPGFDDSRFGEVRLAAGQLAEEVDLSQAFR